MAFSTPSLNDFVRIAENGLSSEFYGEESVLRKSVLKVLARVFAGVAFLLVLLLRKMWKNAFLTTCDVETLEDNGIDYDFPNKPESYAKGRVLVTKTTSSNIEIEQGTILSDDNGNEFEIDSDYTLSGAAESIFTVNVIAVRAGDEGNVSAGTVLAFRDGTPEGVAEDVTVDDEGISGGVSIEVMVNGNAERWGETAENYRERLLFYRRNPPSGGSVSDYKMWCERFPFVTRCIPQQNYPDVNSVTCVLAYYGDDSDSIAVNSTNVEEVEAYVQSDVRRCATADVIVVSCLPKTINFVISLSPNNVNTRASVENALKNVLRSYEPGNVVHSYDLDVALKGSSVADSVAVSSMNNNDLVSLSKENHELPVVGSISWVDPNV